MISYNGTKTESTHDNVNCTACNAMVILTIGKGLHRSSRIAAKPTTKSLVAVMDWNFPKDTTVSWLLKPD